MRQGHWRAATYSACVKIWTAAQTAWRETGGVERYRPEAHYMRGPGPKWRAKYGQPHPLNSDRCEDATVSRSSPARAA
jgi:hypothetical protein